MSLTGEALRIFKIRYGAIFRLLALTSLLRIVPYALQLRLQ